MSDDFANLMIKLDYFWEYDVDKDYLDVTVIGDTSKRYLVKETHTIDVTVGTKKHSVVAGTKEQAEAEMLRELLR